MDIINGKQYRNKKHGTLYQVLGFTQHSETLETMVMYERVESKEREEYPWCRPIELFKEKFEEVTGIVDERIGFVSYQEIEEVVKLVYEEDINELKRRIKRLEDRPE